MAYTDREDLNYAGQLFTLGKTQTPFLSKLLGISADNVNDFDLASAINSGVVRVVNSPYFTVAQPSSLGTVSQDVVTETESMSPTATTVTRSEDTNVTQVHQKYITVSDLKESAYGFRSGINVPGEAINPVSEKDFQVEANMKKMAADIDYSLIKGTYQAPSDTTTAGQTRGLENAISTNATAAGSVTLSSDLIDTTLATMIASGAVLNDIVLIGNSYQVKKINDIYGFANQSFTVGGTNVKEIYTPYGMAKVMFDPHVTSTTLLFTELSTCKLVIQPIRGQFMIVEDKPVLGAGQSVQALIQIGLDYGAEEYHGKITGLLDS